jgi:hypothetical protein
MTQEGKELVSLLIMRRVELAVDLIKKGQTTPPKVITSSLSLSPPY